MNAVEIGLFNKLNGDNGAGGVRTLSTGGIYHVTPNQRAGFPKTVFGQYTPNIPEYTLSTKAVDHTQYYVTPYAVDTASTTGVEVTAQISERSEDLLTDGSITVSGKTVIYLRMIMRMPVLPNFDGDRGIWVFSRPTIFETYWV
jgi:hypothetical protein